MGATNNFEKMGRKQENNFLAFSRNIFPIKMFLFFYFSFLFLMPNKKTGMGKCQDNGNNDLSQVDGESNDAGSRCGGE